MQNSSIAFILLAFLVTASAAAQAETPVIAPSKPAMISPMNDEALASYISGRLKQALLDEDYTVSQSCDASGCSVSVQ